MFSNYDIYLTHAIILSGCEHDFIKSKILKDQACDELKNPTLPYLHEYIEGYIFETN